MRDWNHQIDEDVTMFSNMKFGKVTNGRESFSQKMMPAPFDLNFNVYVILYSASWTKQMSLSRMETDGTEEMLLNEEETNGYAAYRRNF